MCNQCGDTGHVGLGRRGLLGTLSAGLFAGGLFAQPASAQPAGAKPVSVQPARITADAALKRLMDGHKAYMANKASVSGYGAGRAARAGGQTPIAMFLSCADSRVLPELIFNQGPGDIFVCRVAGNVGNEYDLASLEFGAAVLEIPLLVVLGHSGCGAVDAAIKVHRDGAKLPGHLPGLIDKIVPAVKIAEAGNPKDLVAASITENVRHTMRTLSTSQPLLGPKVTSGALKVVGAVYDVGTGKISMV